MGCCSLTASLFGAFRLFLFDGRQPICIKERRKSLENCLLSGACSFGRADFCSGEAKPSAILCVLSRALTTHGRKSARQNRCGFGFRQPVPAVVQRSRCFSTAYTITFVPTDCKCSRRVPRAPRVSSALDISPRGRYNRHRKSAATCG